MIQCKPPVTQWCNNLSLAGKQPVRIKLPLSQIQYLCEVPGFHSAGHIYLCIPSLTGCAEDTSLPICHILLHLWISYLQLLWPNTSIEINLATYNYLLSPCTDVCRLTIISFCKKSQLAASKMINFKSDEIS